MAIPLNMVTTISWGPQVEKAEFGLNRVDPQHEDHSVEVGNEDKSEWQGQCEYTDNQIQTPTDRSVRAEELQQGLNLTGKIVGRIQNGILSTITSRPCNYC